MTDRSEVEKAVLRAIETLNTHGYDCDTTPDELISWFEADTPFEGEPGLDEVLEMPLIVIHELVEIENIKNMGLTLSKDTIIDNLEMIDDAHLKATEVELAIAAATRNVRHLKRRLKSIQMWIEDDTVTDENKAKYHIMHARTLGVIRALDENNEDNE